MNKLKKCLVVSLIICIFLSTPSIDVIKISNIIYAEEESEIEELEAEIAKKSKEIEKNDQDISDLKTKIATNEEKIKTTNDSINKLTKEIKNEEKLINAYLVFMQKLSNERIWLEQLENGTILEYTYNFNKVVGYINKDFQKLNSDVNTLKVQQKKYKETLEQLNTQKSKLEEENKKTNEIYKQLNEELIELEKEVNYEIEYDEDAYILEEDREDLMRSVGIIEEDFTYVDYIVSNESSWNYKVSNPYSGAYGLCQSLPGDKMAEAGDDWKTNAMTQLTWCNGYAEARYGSWAEAEVFWEENNWW